MTSPEPVKLDVREDIRRGREPFSKIMQTVSKLKPNQTLLLLAPFEPKPLYAVLAQHGFSHTAKAIEHGDWEVLFTPEPGKAASPGAGSRAVCKPSCPEALDRGLVAVEVDARGLEPPQPLVKILEAVATLPEGAILQARTDLRPMHLYSQLKARGFAGQSQEQADGSFLTTIRAASISQPGKSTC